MRYQNPKLEKSQNGVYSLRARVSVVRDGKVIRPQQRFIIGAVTKAQAEAIRRKVLDEINRDRMVIQAQVGIGELIDRFIAAHVPTLAVPTQRKYRSLIANHIRPAVGHLSAAELTRQHVQEWINGIPTWALREAVRNCLASILTYAKQNRLWDGEMPTQGVKLGRRKMVREKRLMTTEQFRALLAAVEPVHFISAPDARVLLTLAAGTGLRISEILGLEWSDLEGEHFAVRRRFVRGDTDVPKTESSERRAFVGPLVLELAAMRGRNPQRDRLFAGFDDRDFQQHVLRPAAERAGIYYRGFGMHSFRRTNVSWLLNDGATPFEAARAAGHSSPAVTLAHYALIDAQRQKEQSEKVFGRIM